MSRLGEEGGSKNHKNESTSFMDAPKEEFSSSVFFLLTNEEEFFLVSTLLQGPFTVYATM